MNIYIFGLFMGLLFLTFGINDVSKLSGVLIFFGCLLTLIKESNHGR